MQVSLLTIRLVYTQVFCFPLFYNGHFKLHHFGLQSNSDVQTFCTTASAKRNTWLQFNLKLADRVVFSKELHLSVESIEAERGLQARESSSCPRNNTSVVGQWLENKHGYKIKMTENMRQQQQERISVMYYHQNLTTSSLQLLPVHTVHHTGPTSTQ